jgi:hypothetical protein
LNLTIRLALDKPPLFGGAGVSGNPWIKTVVSGYFLQFLTILCDFCCPGGAPGWGAWNLRGYRKFKLYFF